MYEGIVVDYGHGIDTPGKYYKFTDHQGFECREWITNRMTAARFIKLCVLGNRAHYDCVADRVWTRAEVLASDWSWQKLPQRDVPLRTRTSRANARPRWPLLSFIATPLATTMKAHRSMQEVAACTPRQDKQQQTKLLSPSTKLSSEHLVQNLCTCNEVISPMEITIVKPGSQC